MSVSTIREAAIRVACASTGTGLLDGHFGSCERFLIYRVAPDEVSLVEERLAAAADEAEDRNKARAQLIGDCQILFVQSIGGPAAAKVVRAGVHPVKVPRAMPPEAQLARLQAALASPPPWLAKVMGVPAASLEKFAATTEEA